jgi:hypothetical protein
VNEDDDETEDSGESSPWLLRLVRESVLSVTGRATPTGIHLALYGPDCRGMGAWELGALWGYSEAELDAMRLDDDHLVAVMFEPSERCGVIDADVLARVAHGLVPEDLDDADVDAIAQALSVTPEEAEQLGLRQLQRQAGQVFGLGDGVFRMGRLARTGEARPEPCFFIDEKLSSPELNGLWEGSSLRVDEYPTLATVVRLPWT